MTTDGGKRVLVGRPKGEWNDYLHFRAEVSTSEEEQATLAEFNDDERTRLMLELKLALNRARIGYSGLSSLKGFSIVKRVPITHSLRENGTITAVLEIEAVLNEVFIIGAMAFQRHNPNQTALPAETV